MDSTIEIGKMPIDFYYIPISAPCRVVYTVAKELGLHLNLKYTDIFKDEHKTDEFHKLNPLHTVPTIDDNGYALWESHVIITYFCNKYDSSKSEQLYPKDPQKRANVDKLLFFNIEVLFEAFVDYVWKRRGWTTGDVAVGEAKLTKALQIIEDILQKSPFLTGNDHTLADITSIIYIATLEVMDYDFSSYPKLLNWLSTLKTVITSFEECNSDGLKMAQEIIKKP